MRDATAGGRTFEAVARGVLDTIIAAAQRTLAGSRWASNARILRGMVHVRPEDGYRRLFAAEAGGNQPRDMDALAPSASAWRWLVEHDRPLTIDVNLGIVEVGVDGVEPAREAGRFGNQTVSAASQARMLARKATHILVLPLRAPSGRIDGMLTIEGDCLAATGHPFVWAEVVAGAQAVADRAAPYLLGLPSERSAAEPEELLPVIGATMRPLIEMLRIFARQDDTILLSGPTGAGKSRLARWCHARSRRHAGPFETVDLGGIPEELQAGELFGWKRGAFTGATRDTAGAIGRAQGGTLFIDEIDKLSLRAQGSLLRVVEDRRFRPLGDAAPEQPADVRFIVGTNANLEVLARAGSFRRDLLYRIQVLPVHVPALIDRRDELAAWARFMLARRDPAAGITDEALAVLEAQSWPGNLRQLDNIIRRAFALSQLEATVGPPSVERGHVERALALEGHASPGALFDALRLAAEELVTAAERVGEAGFDLAHADALRGLTLAAAARRLGSVEAAFKLFGKAAMVERRNHGRAYRQEWERVEELARLLHVELPGPPE